MAQHVGREAQAGEAINLLRGTTSLPENLPAVDVGTTEDRRHAASHHSQRRAEFLDAQEGKNVAEEPDGRVTPQRAGDDGRSPGACTDSRSDPERLHAPEKTPRSLKVSSKRPSSTSVVLIKYT